MDVIQRVKTALRISHTRLDEEIAAEIAVARGELIRAGVGGAAAAGEDPLIQEAVVTYCLYRMAPEENQKYHEAFVYQADNLRKSAKYKAVGP